MEVFGRILAVDSGGGRLTLLHRGQALMVAADPDLALPAAGDWVRATLVGTASIPRLAALEILTAYGLEAPFPSPGGEFYRLHQGAPGRAGRLAFRGRCLAAIRAFFAARDYLEVQTPCLVRHPGLEPHLRPLPAGDGGHLITSPEYQMKRLLAGGLERIYNMGPCWRGDETGAHHLREFCMLEWYRAFSPLESLMEETEALVAGVAREVLGRTLLDGGAHGQLELAPPWARISVAQAAKEHGGVDLAGVLDAGELGRRVAASGLILPTGELSFEAIFSQLMVERVEPALARLGRPVLLYDFPAPLAALSRLRPEDPTVAGRFEVYAGGLELANAFWELTDWAEQRRRLEQDRSQRRAEGAAVHALDERFLAALAEGIPPTSGIALGVDRLVMLLAEVEDIRQVVAFAPDEI
jgi:elongation factor P--(R)-beta-lysine ligase